MTIPDPPWKQKTRPCPFYSQGRCLFSDSCNFLHDVKIRVKQPHITITDSTPDVTISSPPSVSADSPTTRNTNVRSPPRSPRLSSLLLALGNAIQPDEEDFVESSSSIVLPPNAIVPYSRASNQDLLAEVPDVEDTEPLSTSGSSNLEREHVQEIESEALADEEAPTESSGLLSPIEVKLGQLDGPSHREDSIDSGYADNWTGPLPFALSPPKPTASRRYSTLSLLSSPFGSPVRALSPKFGPSSGSAWPSSPLFSPVTSKAGSRPSSLRLSQASEDLDSPTDYHRGQLSAGSPSVAADEVDEVDEDVTIRKPLSTTPEEQVAEKTVVPSNKVLDQTVTSIPKKLPERVVLEPLTSIGPIEEAPSAVDGVTETAVPVEHPEQANDSLLEEDTSALYSTYYSEALYTNSPRNVELFSTSPAASPVRQRPITPSASSTPRSLHSESGPPEFVTGSSKDDDASHYEQTLNTQSPVRPVHSLASPSDRSPQALQMPPHDVSPMKRNASTDASQRVSTKVPFGFRSSLARSTNLIASRPGSAPPVRHRPPALVGLSSGRSQSLNENAQVSPEEPPSSSRSSSRLKPLRLSMLLNSSTPSLLSSTSSNVFPAVTASSFTDYSQPSSPSVKSEHSLSHNPLLSTTHSERIPHRNSTIAIPARSQSLEYSHQSHSLPLSAPPTHTSHTTPATWNNIAQSPHRISSRLSYLSRPSSRLSERNMQPPIHEDEPLVFSHAPIRDYEEGGRQDSPSEPYLEGATDTFDARQIVQQSPYSPLHEQRPSSRPVSIVSPVPAVQVGSRIPSPLVHHEQHSSPSHRRSLVHPVVVASSIPLHHIALQSPSPSSPSSPAAQQFGPPSPSHHDSPPSRRVSLASSLPHSPVHAIATPRPTLIFAIASDNPAEVRRVLESGEASPNDDVGPQSALAFALTSGQLKNRTEMVKLLLAYGADPASVKAIGTTTTSNPLRGADGEADAEVEGEFEEGQKLQPPNPLEAVDPATRYYISRAEAPQTRRASALIHRSFFRPLTKVRYEMVGQDRALEQLFRVLSMPALAPIVVLLCGPSGHGKSLLARRFGSLLDVPTHTVNMTTLRSTHDIWRSYSMSPYEEPSSLTLADFLIENEGKRCVVVLDEIEKTENDTILSSLLMPWELGRCSFEAGHRHVNVSKVIWLGTSNIGHDLVFEHHSSRASPSEPMTRDEYVDLMGILRPVVSDRLGPSLLSRVTTVLPFVPFTNDEKLAIAAEALFSLAEDAATQLPSATVEKLVKDALHSYVPAEGARSLYRAVSAQLLDTL